ncbi:MAG: 3-deoxy-7-phosphoheptulonate synthase, partial [Gammaproteobacteria bacterium]|nr:3-deoxy-7-phosphoheptulonate synthase [Gammaproteobacteria bacterium]
MIVILQPDIEQDGPEARHILAFLNNKPGIAPQVHEVVGSQQRLTEIYLVGDTYTLDQAEIESLPGVERVVRVSREYRILGRHRD